MNKKYIFTTIGISITMACAIYMTGCNQQTSSEIMQTEAESQITEKEAEIPDIGISNPLTEYDSLDEVNEATGASLVSLAGLGATDEQFIRIDCGDYQIAEYRFSIDEGSYILRSASVTEDISGLYFDDGNPAFTDTDTDTDMYVINTDNWKAARWFDKAQQYVLICNDSEDAVSIEFFSDFADSVKNELRPKLSEEALIEFYASLAGDYEDRISQRAGMKLIADGANGVKIQGSWGSSAWESTEWTGTAYLDENGYLLYEDGITEEVTYEDDGTRRVDQHYEGFGFFSITEDGVLIWEEANPQYLIGCEFVKIENTASLN